ncbi:MAG TPA: S8 family serine peptidase [Candidatus Limnocylindrales bacterium]|nr:S8 family serine peptidase [Candidatus Limnocylindrales bacterium]
MHRVLASLVLAVLLAGTAAIQVSAAGPAPSPPDRPTTAGSSIDATDRYIVVLRTGADTTAIIDKASRRDGVKADRTFRKAVHGFSAKLDPRQRLDLAADPNVLAVVPDEVIHVAAQTVPTGVSRIFGKSNPIAKIDGVDQRVDADVAIVDTGIAYHPDLNVAGGYNCSTSDHTAWRDVEDHGTHVAGTVGAIDNGSGVVGVAPGVRLWGVKILNDKGDGLISWYVCGLDWILAQRDPKDPSRPLFEAVNMSVTKAGSDDKNCGLTNDDLLHQAICRVVAGGITVVAAAANDSHSATHNIPASYDEVITVSALADTDGKPGGLGGNACYSWGGYDKDDTFADFSNYGYDVDLIAPGKCIKSTIPGGYGTMSGTSMAAPAVTGAVALYKSSRPNATPAEVREALRYLGNLNWKTSTDPDPTHEPLLDVSRLGNLGTFTLAPAPGDPPAVEANGSATSIPFTVDRSSTFFERVGFKVTSLPDGWTAATPASLMGWTADDGHVAVTVPKGTPVGSYAIDIQGTNQGRTESTTLTVDVVSDPPTAKPPVTSLVSGVAMSQTSTAVRIGWPAATDPHSPIASYQVQVSKNGGAWGGTVSRSAAQLREATYTLAFDATYLFRVRAMDAAGNWSPWVDAVSTSRVHPYDDRSSSLYRVGTWSPASSSSAYRSTLSGATKGGTKIGIVFTGHSVAVVNPMSAHMGKAKVWVDGIYKTTLNLKTSTSKSRRVLYAQYFPTGGTHRISISVVGGGTYPLVRLDAFVVSR